MKRLLLTLLALVAVAAPATAQIPLDRVTVTGSDAAVLQFPTAGAQLTEIRFEPQTMFLSTTGTDQWPAVPVSPGGEPAQAATLWVFEQIGGQWYATGAERLRPSQLNGPKPESDPATLIGKDWLYDPNRWGPMAGYNPQSGEHVGFMVVAGSTRSDNNTPLKARTPVVEVVWAPGSSSPLQVVWTESGAVPPPVPPQPPTPPSLEPRVQALEQQVNVLSAMLNSVVANFESRISALEARPIIHGCSAALNFGATRIPISCAVK